MKVLWPFGVVLRGMASNRLELRWLKTVVASVEEKATVSCQVGTGKTNVSEPLLKRRDLGNGIRTGVSMQSRDESGGCPDYWPVGVRRAGGVSPVCGLCVELGKARADTAAARGSPGLVRARGSAPNG